MRKMCVPNSDQIMLTDTKLRNIHGKPYDGPEEVPDAGGLSARISPRGVISFQYRYRFNGKPRRMKIGTYGEITLKEARAEVAAHKEVLNSGRDPSVAKRMHLSRVTTRATVEDIVREYMESTQARSMVNYKQVEAMLNKHVIRPYGSYIVDDMDAMMWEGVFRKVANGGAPVQAGIVLNRMKAVIKYAMRRRRVDRDDISLLRVKDVGKNPAQGKRVLSIQEIRHLISLIDSSKMARLNQILMKLIIFTGCRTSELTNARREHFDLDNCVWTVPGALSKNRNEFKRGLSDVSVDLLREAMDLHSFNFVFVPVLSGRDEAVDRSVPKTAARDLMMRMGGEPWSCHDLRRTVRTNLSALGVAPHVSEKVLGHKLAGMLAIYDQYDYVREQIEAMNKLADYYMKPIDLQNEITS